MSLDPRSLPEEALAFLRERHLATLTTLRADGSPHVVPVGVTFDPTGCVARVITFASSTKVANARRGGRAAVCQVDGGRWLTLEGPVRVTSDPDRVAEAVAAYAERYRPPKQREDRVVIEIDVDRVLGSSRW
jgi:PPOX class probable F420-dependent enzyme